MSIISRALMRWRRMVAAHQQKRHLARHQVEADNSASIHDDSRFLRDVDAHISIGPNCLIEAAVDIRARNGGQIALHSNVILRPHCFLNATGGALTIGERTFFNTGCYIGCAERVVIGTDCLFGPHVNLNDCDHGILSGIPIQKQPLISKPIQIGNDVWIGGNATVCKGVAIGDGAVIGANAVVTRDIPPGAIAVGIPARVLRYREPGEMVESIESIRS